MLGGILVAMGLLRPGGVGESVLAGNTLRGTEFLGVAGCEEVTGITPGTWVAGLRHAVS